MKTVERVTKHELVQLRLSAKHAAGRRHLQALGPIRVTTRLNHPCVRAALRLLHLNNSYIAIGGSYEHTLHMLVNDHLLRCQH